MFIRKMTDRAWSSKVYLKTSNIMEQALQDVHGRSQNVDKTPQAHYKANLLRVRQLLYGGMATNTHMNLFFSTSLFCFQSRHVLATSLAGVVLFFLRRCLLINHLVHCGN